MADTPYRVQNFVFKSLGVVARFADDQTPDGTWLNQDNCEELAENSMGSRLGTAILNRSGNTIDPLSGLVHSLAKLAGLNGSAWRYAGAGTSLYRRTGLSQGPYTLISNTMSGQPWQGVVYRPDASSLPYLFIADAAGMLKDYGTLSAPQQMGIFQPQYPVQAQAQEPDLIILDNYTGSSGDYSYTGIGGGTIGTYVNTTLTSAVTATGIQTVSVADPTQPGLFQLLTIDSGGSQETVLALFVTPTGFTADFTKTHTIGATVTSKDLSVTVPASTTATVSKSFGGMPIAAWPTTLFQEDYIGLYLYVTDPTQVQSIQLAFDCGDGSFNSDYFYKVIAQGPLQALLSTATSNTAAATTAATNVLLNESLGLYGNSSSSITELNTGLDNWSPLLIQLSDFAGAGRADFNDPVFNWAAVNGYQITIVMNDNSSATFKFSSLILFGGAGPDSFAGVGYDWLFTFFNINDYTESNPCMVMSNVNPPLLTNWVVPRRQPVLLTLNYATPDTQSTHLRIYRRGGTLGDNYRRVDQIPLTTSGQQYLDISSDEDIQASDFISFTNDVPVTSSLPNPVNSTLDVAIGTMGDPVNTTVSVFPVSMADISLRQQVTIGLIGGPIGNVETVIVLSVSSDHFTAFVQNAHAVGEPVTATAQYGQPVTIMAQAFSQFWFAGDPNNPHYLYWSAASNPQAVSSAAYVEVGVPSDPITVIEQFKGNLYVSTGQFWWAVAPGSNSSQQPTVYPTAAKHGCVAPRGWCATEEAIYYQAIDGIRMFAGGASQYLTQDQEFIFQGIGSSPIVEADQTQLSQTVMAYWNNYVYVSYIGVDGNRHRIAWHTIYKRWRNDDVDAQSILLESDTNTLVFGDSIGLVHLDRQPLAYDEGNNAGVLTELPIALTLQSPYRDQGLGERQKNYQELQMDVNTNGQDLIVTLLFDDGNSSIDLGTINTAERQKVNLPIEDGSGYQAYKVSLQISGSVTQRIYIYQAALKALPLAMTRRSFDSYWLKLGTDESKICKQVYFEYNAGSAITFNVYYDGSDVPFYSFTIPEYAGIRNAIRVRLPAVNFRLIRITAPDVAADFQIWEDSKLDWKPLCSGKGYQTAQFVP